MAALVLAASLTGCSQVQWPLPRMQPAVRPAAPRLYVAVPDSNKVYAISYRDDVIVKSISLPGAPTACQALADGRSSLLVACAESGRLHLLSQDGHPAWTIDVGGAPVAIALTPKGDTALIADKAEGQLLVMNVPQQKMESRITCGAGSAAIAVSPDATTAYVLNRTAETLSIVSLTDRSVRQTIPVGPGPVDVAVDPQGRYVYVTCFRSDDVWVFDAPTMELITRLRTGRGPGRMHCARNGLLYVVNAEAGSVAVVQPESLQTMGASTMVGVTPDEVVLSPLEDVLYLSMVGIPRILVLSRDALEPRSEINLDNKPTDLSAGL